MRCCFRLFAVALLGVQAVMTTPAAAKTIVETAREIGTFDILMRAVKAAGLTETLNSPGPYTLFAPTDDAFGKLPRGTVETLLKPENKEKLKAILTHHIVAGTILARDVMGKRMEASTVQGGLLTIDATRVTMIENARITKFDIEADNGMIHVIDTVLLP